MVFKRFGTHIGHLLSLTQQAYLIYITERFATHFRGWLQRLLSYHIVLVFENLFNHQNLVTNSLYSGTNFDH